MDHKELKERQGWSFNQKIDHSLGVIEEFYNKTDVKCYTSFSGGKDSTVLNYLCNMVKKDIKPVFCNTGNEYPDIVNFARNTEGVEIIKPKLTPKDVIELYGFPLISKDQSQCIREIKNTKSEKLRNIRLNNDGSKTIGVLYKKYYPILQQQFGVSEYCCKKLKKDPFKVFEKRTALYPILGTMASESRLRASTYVRNGKCNVFNEKRNMSSPISIWTEEDIFKFIDKFDVKISDVYSKGIDRTGCMFCGFGCQFENDNRLKFLFKTYPKMYNMFMNLQNNDISYREAIKFVLQIDGLKLPDEN